MKPIKSLPFGPVSAPDARRSSPDDQIQGSRHCIFMDANEAVAAGYKTPAGPDAAPHDTLKPIFEELRQIRRLLERLAAKMAA